MKQQQQQQTKEYNMKDRPIISNTHLTGVFIQTEHDEYGLPIHWITDDNGNDSYTGHIIPTIDMIDAIYS